MRWRHDALADLVKHHVDGVEGRMTKPQSLEDLSAEECHTLEEQQLLFQHVTRELSEFIEKEDERFLSEMTPAAEFFFGGHKPPPHIKNAADFDLAYERMREWFIYERVSRRYRRRPYDVYLERLPHGPQREFAARLAENSLDPFEVKSVVPGVGLRVCSLRSEQCFETFERTLSRRLRAGAVLVGRIFPLNDHFWTLSPVIIPLSDPHVTDRIRTGLAQLPPHERGFASQSEIEALLMGEPQNLGPGDLQDASSETVLASRAQILLSEAGVELSADDMRTAMLAAESAVLAVERLFRRAKFVNTEHGKEAFEVLMKLWNATPHPEHGGRNPRQQAGLTSPGPRELELMNQFLKETPDDNPGGAVDDVDMPTIEARARHWLSQPRPELGGRTPNDVIAAERARRMDDPLPSSSDLGVVKISSKAPCPCGSGKRYKRCCGNVRH